MPALDARAMPAESPSSQASAFVKKTRGRKGACTVCGREFDTEARARAHVEALMSVGAFGDHMQIHAPESAFTSTPSYSASARRAAEEAAARSRGWRFW